MRFDQALCGVSMWQCRGLWTLSVCLGEHYEMGCESTLPPSSLLGRGGRGVFWWRRQMLLRLAKECDLVQRDTGVRLPPDMKEPICDHLGPLWRCWGGAKGRISLVESEYERGEEAKRKEQQQLTPDRQVYCSDCFPWLSFWVPCVIPLLTPSIKSPTPEAGKRSPNPPETRDALRRGADTKGT